MNLRSIPDIVVDLHLSEHLSPVGASMGPAKLDRVTWVTFYQPPRVSI
jgi:hypothetical protein